MYIHICIYAHTHTHTHTHIHTHVGVILRESAAMEQANSEFLLINVYLLSSSQYGLGDRLPTQILFPVQNSRTKRKEEHQHIV